MASVIRCDNMNRQLTPLDKSMKRIIMRTAIDEHKANEAYLGLVMPRYYGNTSIEDSHRFVYIDSIRLSGKFDFAMIGALELAIGGKAKTAEVIEYLIRIGKEAGLYEPQATMSMEEKLIRCFRHVDKMLAILPEPKNRSYVEITLAHVNIQARMLGEVSRLVSRYNTGNMLRK